MIKEIVLAMWQLPQLLLGLIVLGIIKLIDRNLVIKKSSGFYIAYTKLNLGVSFGTLIILGFPASVEYVWQEKGHSMQSILLGPTYIFIVGIP